MPSAPSDRRSAPLGFRPVIPIRRAVRSAALAAALPLAACADGPPPAPEFNADRAWAWVGQQIAFGPRYPGNRGHGRARDWLLHELRFRADTVVRQDFTAPAGDGRRLKLTNVVARFRPELPGRVLLVANWDTRRHADAAENPLDRRLPVPGANVNASGVAVLMEVAQLMTEQPPPVGVDLLFADGDDYSAQVQMAGTRHFVGSMPGYRPRYAVVVQAVADVDALFPIDTASGPARRLWHAARRLGYDSVFVHRPGPPPPNQGPVLAAAGIPTLVIADREYGPLNRRWHTPDDLSAFLSKETLALVGRTLVALLYAEAPSSGAAGEGGR